MSSSVFPNAVDTFTSDHHDWHADHTHVNDAVVAIQTAVGTTTAPGIVVQTSSVPGGSQGTDGLVPISSVASPGGFVWSAGGQVFPTTGPPDDSILGVNYSPQPLDSPEAYDPAAGAFYVRALSPVTGAPVWFQVNANPAVINGGT